MRGADRSWSYAFSDAGDLTSKSDVGAYVLGKGHQVASAGGQGYTFYDHVEREDLGEDLAHVLFARVAKPEEVEVSRVAR